MSKQDRWMLPEGIEEVLPEDATRLELLRRDVLDLFARWGYRLVVTPLIEFLDSLLVGTGRDLDLQTFKLIDQISGRLMGIRADMTPQVARIDARTAKDGVPARLCYLGTVLHTQSDHLERSRSPMQVGAELYGYAGHPADVEIIRLMLDTLAVAGIVDVHLDLGHVGIYRGLAERAGLSDSQEADLFELLQRKDRSGVDDFLAETELEGEVAEMLAALLDLHGTEQILGIAGERLAPGGPNVRQALTELAAIHNALKPRFPALPMNFDLAELRAYHYQTGVVFAAFVPGYGREIARGGRYDDIGKVFGCARPATGFSADLRVLGRLSAFRSSGVIDEIAVFAPASDDHDLDEAVRLLRAEGRVVIQELPGQVAEPAAVGCRYRLQKLGDKWTVLQL